MTEVEFHMILGRLTREQGWSLESIAALALGFIARNKTQRSMFIRHLRRIQREENAGRDANGDLLD